jgi:hypothetical protein
MKDVSKIHGITSRMDSSNADIKIVYIVHRSENA